MLTPACILLFSFSYGSQGLTQQQITMLHTVHMRNTLRSLLLPSRCVTFVMPIICDHRLYRVLVPVVGIICAVPMNVVPAAHLSYSIEYKQGVAPTLDHFLKWYAGLLFLVILALVLQGQ
jgi:hypothetical protein